MTLTATSILTSFRQAARLFSAPTRKLFVSRLLTSLILAVPQPDFPRVEYKLAKKISDSIETVDMFRMMGSGTEACMGAARIARLATKHKNIIKMGGAYHGWSDQMAYGIRVNGTKFTQAHGVPLNCFMFIQETTPNDLDELERKLRLNQFRGGTAAVYMEPVGPRAVLPPSPLNMLRALSVFAANTAHSSYSMRLLQVSVSVWQVLKATSAYRPTLPYSVKLLQAVIRVQAASAVREST